MFACRQAAQFAFRTCARPHPFPQPHRPEHSQSIQRLFRTQTSFRQSLRRGPQYRYTRYETNKNVFQRWAASPSFYYQVGGLAVVGGGFYTYNLETVPVSGRRRFNFIGPEMEESISKGQYAQIVQEYRGRILPESAPQARKVRQILDRYGPLKSRLHVTKADWNGRQIGPSQWPAGFELGGFCDTERRAECLCYPWV
jgi:hypothetical protein